MKYKCLLCSRCKFDRPSPHRCLGRFRKRGLKWEEIKPINNNKMKQFITEEELIYLYKGNTFAMIADIINQRFTEMTTPKQPEPLPEFEPFDIERAREGEDVWHENGIKAKEFHVFKNDEVSVLWEDLSYITNYKEDIKFLRHKRKPKPIEFEGVVSINTCLAKPFAWDKIELIGSIDGKDFMKATADDGSFVYYIGKFNDGNLK